MPFDFNEYYSQSQRYIHPADRASVHHQRTFWDLPDALRDEIYTLNRSIGSYAALVAFYTVTYERIYNEAKKAFRKDGLGRVDRRAFDKAESDTRDLYRWLKFAHEVACEYNRLALSIGSQAEALPIGIQDGINHQLSA